MQNKVYITITKDNTSTLTFPHHNIKTTAHIGKNGATHHKKEGDGKTPLGKFHFGFLLGMHPKSELTQKTPLPYTQINQNQYCIDDPNSKYYNKLIDITKVKKDWTSAEHLIEFPIQYEYLIEIKTNPHNIPGKGSAIFLHCTNHKSTAGCIAIDRLTMEKLIYQINKKTEIIIQKI